MCFCICTNSIVGNHSLPLRPQEKRNLSPAPRVGRLASISFTPTPSYHGSVLYFVMSCTTFLQYHSEQLLVDSEPFPLPAFTREDFRARVQIRHRAAAVSVVAPCGGNETVASHLVWSPGASPRHRSPLVMTKPFIFSHTLPLPIPQQSPISFLTPGSPSEPSH